MLEADEIDDDYFTPVPSTSLANIFGSSKNKETANESLKYTPPKKQVPQETNVPLNVEPKAEEDTKVTECMLACALTAYEWVENNYVSKGKLGFAILKILKTHSFSIVLYNSNKTTLSNTPVTSKLNVTLKGNNYISYYDSHNKYWSLYGKEDEVYKVTETLKTLGVDLKHTSSIDQNPPEPLKKDNLKTSTVDKGSDTDSSINRKTKVSILNRMANMGHSVLPSSPLVDKSSDSSDSNKIEDKPPKIRPKPSKAAMKRTSIEKKESETDKADSVNMPVAKLEQYLSSIQALNPSLFAMVNGQLVPVSNTSVSPIHGSSSNNEINLFMTEQRMNNNELRVNINRATDKVDQVLEKLKVLDKIDGDKGNNFQIELMQKLLTEYENKIKKYEQMLASKKVDNQTSDLSTMPETVSYEKQILNLLSTIEEKDKEIIKLNDILKDHELVKEIKQLKEKLALKTNDLEKITKELDESRANKEGSIQAFDNRLKDVVNDVYHSISSNFESGESYSGESVKKKIASILKKATIQSISEYNSET